MPENEVSEKSDLSLFAEISDRLKTLEASHADLSAQLAEAKQSLTVEPYKGFGAHVVHVMQKHFYHDRPDTATADAD